MAPSAGCMYAAPVRTLSVARGDCACLDWIELTQRVCLCAQVRIKGFYPVGDKASGFVVFDIEVTSREVSATRTATIPPWSHFLTHASRVMITLVPFYLQGTVFHALKRYSAFVQLRNDLLRALPNLKGQIPRLPPKSSLCK